MRGNVNQFFTMALLLGCLGGWTNARQISGTLPETTSPSSFRGVSLTPIAERIDEALRSSAAVDFHETRLEDALAEISADQEFAILIHESTFDYGLDADTLVNFSVSGIPLASVLENILEPYDCTIAIHHDVLKIVSADWANHAALERRVYDCSELLEKFQSADPVQNTSRIIDVLTTSVDPDSWLESGGYAGISEIEGRLVIAQTLQNHLMIERLLNALDREMQH